MFKVSLTARAKKELKNLPEKHKKAVSLAIDDIRDFPTIGKSLTRELTGYFSLKIAAYRIIYKIDKKDRMILIMRVGHRSKVYN